MLLNQQGNIGGLVIALTILAAIRMSRDRADSERLDVSALQARQQESRVQGAELREKRRAFLEAERRAKEAAAAERMQQVH